MIEFILDSKYKLDGFDPGQVLALTLQEADFRTLVERGGTLSNKINIAKTQNNQRVLGLLDNLESTLPRAYDLYQCEVMVGNLKIFSGSCVIMESSTFITIRIFSAASGLFSKLKGRALNSIDLSSFNHTWTAANVNSRRQNTTGVVYPNINYGRWTDVTKNDRSHTDFFPAVFIETIIDRAVQGAGYSYTSLDNFKSAIPFSQKFFRQNVSLANSKVELTADQLLTAGTIGPQGDYLHFDTEVLDPVNIFRNRTSGGNDYTALETGAGTLSIQVLMDFSAPGTNLASGELRIIKDGSRVVRRIISPGETGSINFELDIENGSTSTKAVYIIEWASINTGDECTVLEGATWEVLRGDNEILDGDVIPIQDTLPDMEITDLLKYVAVRENALMLVDNEEKTFEFVRFSEIVKNFKTAVDWSDKINESSESRVIKYRLEEYAQNNHLDYLIPDTEVDQTASPNTNGRGTFTIDDQSLQTERVEYLAPFYRTGKFIGFKEEKITPYIPRYAETADFYFQESLEPKVRVLDIEQDNTLIVNISGVATITPQANAYFNGFDVDIADHYQEFQTALNPTKKLVALLNLTLFDIQNFDIRKPVIIDNGYFYVLKISQYQVNADTPTRVELLKIL